MEQIKSPEVHFIDYVFTVACFVQEPYIQIRNRSVPDLDTGFSQCNACLACGASDVTGLASVRQMSQVYATGLACGASDVTGLACVMASVRQMSCHVMLKLPLH